MFILIPVKVLPSQNIHQNRNCNKKDQHTKNSTYIFQRKTKVYVTKKKKKKKQKKTKTFFDIFFLDFDFFFFLNKKNIFFCKKIFIDFDIKY